jgi:regulator of sigma D
MSDEKMIINKEDYHKILETMKQMGKNHDDEDLFELGDRIYELNELLEKADSLETKLIDLLADALHNGRISMNTTFRKGDK